MKRRIKMWSKKRRAGGGRGASLRWPLLLTDIDPFKEAEMLNINQSAFWGPRGLLRSQFQRVPHSTSEHQQHP